MSRRSVLSVGRRIKRLPLLLLPLALLAILGPSCSGQVTGGLRQLERVPSRPSDAMTGTQFARATARMTGRERQQAAVAEILRGNVPSFVHLLRPVTLEGRLANGKPAEVTVWVTPDYVAIGSDEDFLRMPLTLPSATQVARSFDCVLPTSRIVDAIWHQADVHFTPAPLRPGPQMRSTEYYLRHRALIDGQRSQLNPELLVAGHKKDVVLTGLLSKRPDRIAIYGWHRPDGNPIQPLSTVHGARYADYSHGLRLVQTEAALNGRKVSIFDILEDPALAPLLSAEGAIPQARKLMGLRRSTSGASPVAGG